MSRFLSQPERTTPPRQLELAPAGAAKFVICDHTIENYIKDHKRFLHSDRTSCHKFEANQFRVFLHSAAYVLMHTFKTTGLRGTAWSHAQFNQIQLRLLKVGARIEEWKTKVPFHFPSAFPLKEVYARIVANVSGVSLCRSP